MIEEAVRERVQNWRPLLAGFDLAGEPAYLDQLNARWARFYPDLDKMKLGGQLALPQAEAD